MSIRALRSGPDDFGGGVTKSIGAPLNSRLSDLIALIENQNVECCEERLSKFKVDIAEPHISTVLGSLVARQTTLANEFLRSPGTWNPNVAPLFLRPMGDCYINFE